MNTPDSDGVTHDAAHAAGGPDGGDPTTLPLADLRSLRAELQSLDDVVSYVRRVCQARLDLIDTELERRSGGSHVATAELAAVLGQHLTQGPARPPRPAIDVSGHPLAVEFEDLCSQLGIAHLDGLDDAALRLLRDRLGEFEQARSRERKQLFARIDALSAELVRRYRDGEADVDGLLADDE